MSSYLVTGCSRGLGLELVRQLAAGSAKTVIATARAPHPTTDLENVIKSAQGRIHFVQLDQDDSASIQRAFVEAEKLLDKAGLNVLINNAATQYKDDAGTPGMEHLDQTLRTNVVSIHNVTAAFLPLLRQAQPRKIINISSTLGLMSMAEIFAPAPVASYKISKAALNMLTVQYALDLAKEEFIVMAISPGNMKTDLGGADAELSTKDGALATIDIIEHATQKENGTFKNISIPGNPTYDGTHPGW